MADDPSRPQAAVQTPAPTAPAAPAAHRAAFGPNPAAAPADTDELAADYSKTPKNSFAEYLAQQEKDGKKSRLSAAEKKLLNGLQTCPGTSGGKMLFDGGGKPFAAVLKDGTVAVADDHALDSAEHIDAVLKSALVAKSSMPQTYINGNGLHAALMVKCAEMAGLKVVGTRPDKTLKEMDPALDAKVEAEWKKMGGAVPAPAAHAGKVVEADAATFKQEVLDSKKPVILEVSDPNCHWCRKEDPEVDKVAALAGDKAKVVRINMHELYDYMQSLPENDPLRQKLSEQMENPQKPFGVPAHTVFEQGQMKDMQSGYMEADRLRNWVNTAAGQTIVPAAAAASGPVQQPRPQ